MENRSISTSWTPEFLRGQLENKASLDGTVEAHVFFHQDIAAEDLLAAAREAISAAAAKLGTSATATALKVNRLAKAVKVTGDIEIICEVLKCPSVKAVLPSVIDDIRPAPIAEASK